MINILAPFACFIVWFHCITNFFVAAIIEYRVRSATVSTIAAVFFCSVCAAAFSYYVSLCIIGYAQLYILHIFASMLSCCFHLVWWQWWLQGECTYAIKKDIVIAFLIATILAHIICELLNRVSNV